MGARVPSTPLADEELMEGFKRGDEASFVELYNRYNRRVFAYCMKMLGNRELAEDIFQEVFVRISRKRMAFISGSFAAWLFSIVRNLCLNAIRDRVQHLPLEDAESVTQTAADEAEYDESLELLRQGIEQLPPDMREPLILRVYNGLSYQEIAEVMQMKVPTVKVRVFRAKQRLQQLLAPYLTD